MAVTMRLLLDTNRYCDLVICDPEVTHRVATADEVWLPFITVAELKAGFAAGTRREKNDAELAKFLADVCSGILFPDLESLERFADLFAQIRQNGETVATNDLWIATLAMQHDLVVDTRDTDFQRVPGLKLVG
jgi:tRNA(fMet)-specific endonuclease VapC